MMAIREGNMNRETRKPGAGSGGPSERGKQHVDPSGAPSLADDEFHDFFSKGDIGDYEGGVARSEPPPKLLQAQPGEPPRVHVAPEHLARRAFFARVVGGVVGGCVLLLVVAAQFGGRKSTQPSLQVERVLAAQPVSAPMVPVKPALLTEPPVPEPVVVKPVAAPEAIPPAAVDVNDAVPVGAPVPLAHAQAAAPGNAEVRPSESTAQVAKVAPKVTEQVAPPVAAPSRALKLAARPAAKSMRAVTPEVKPTVSSPAAPKQSFAAFPVD